MRIVERSLVWRGMDEQTLEHLRLWRHDDGWSFEGTVVAVLDERPTSARYEVVLDRAWITRSVVARQSRGSETTTIQLHADAERRWWHGSTELEHLRGCLDIDLSVTPATNTLPIRRLRLAPGESARVVAVWLRFPSLEIRRLAQTYTRLDDDRYRYQSEGGFEAELSVDELGLVRRYGDLWETLAAE